jgi:dTDP-4-dehydrorhamnose 3,5-epimerase
LSRFAVRELPLVGLRLVERKPFSDARGFFTRIFCADELRASGWTKPIAQINHTYTSQRGTVRGMHYQNPPHAEIKLVSCLRGEVWDVAVDIRASSSTFLQWHAERLSGENGRAMLIPEGFAHGFQALTDDVELLYCHSAAYAIMAEAGLNATDPRLTIGWPLSITEQSSKDLQYPLLNECFAGLAL